MNLAFIISLLAVGLVLLLLEIFVVPGIGVAGFAGAGAFIAACYLTFSKYGTTYGLAVTALSLLLLGILIWYALREKTWKRVALETKVESSAGQDASGVAVGDKGTAATRLAPMGTVQFACGKFEVKCESGFTDPGSAVEVVSVENNMIIVKTVKE